MTQHTLSVNLVVFANLFIPAFSPAQSLYEPPSANLQALAREFWDWRVTTQPATYDDVNRVERPEGWTPDFSAAALRQQDEKQREFHRRLQALDHTGWTVSDSVDYLVLRAAIARVHYELNVLRSARRNPDFCVQQTLGAVYELLLQPPPFDDTRAKNLIIRMQSIPETVKHAQENLTEPVGIFAEVALANLANVRERLEQVKRELAPLFPKSQRQPLAKATDKAAAALEEFAAWLQEQKPDMAGEYAIGPAAYDWYLRTIALIPMTRAEMLELARQEWDRSVMFHHLEQMRNEEVPPSQLFKNANEQIAACQRQEQEIRGFLVQRDILDIPEWMGHYGNLKMPEYIRPLSGMGVVDDLTAPSRLGANAVSYIPEPSPDLSFFRRACAEDPRPIIVHEGVPGHFFQLCLSWANPNLIRRHYVDSGPIEGIGFYAEELMLQLGLFDDAPHTREIIYRFMRLRALRVEVDIKLATGEFSIEEAGRYLAETVPMDRSTAETEAAFFASNPGQAISYQIGKIQILRLLSRAKIKLGSVFNLRAFHNYLWQNGNVPIALQEWELLGDGGQAREFFGRNTQF